MGTCYPTVGVPTINTTTILFMFVNVQASYEIRLWASTAIGQVENSMQTATTAINSGHRNDYTTIATTYGEVVLLDRHQ